MESCLLCLEINKDIVDCIKVNSSRWQELDIEKTIEKHFWSLTNVQHSSWICVSCWRVLHDFHTFFLRIEEAHANFGRIKVEDSTLYKKCKEFRAEKTTVEDISRRSDNDNMVFFFLEPEVLMHQSQQQELTEPEILIGQPKQHKLVVNNETSISDPINKLVLDNVSLKQKCKRLKSNLANKDPLESSEKFKKKQTSKAKSVAKTKFTQDDKVEYSTVKREKMDSVNDVSDNESNNNVASDVTYRHRKTSTETAEYKRHIRKENDKFIADHFKKMICNICQVAFEDFPAMQKHFIETHKQRGYVVCCKRKFFDRTRLVDHLHSHLNPDHFKCNECGKAMSDRIRLVNHMLRVHRANEVIKQHSCEVCGKSFPQAYVLRIHKLTHLPEEEKKFHCSDCGKNYGSSYLLNQHKKVVHLKRFAKICYICGKAINSSAEFKAHMNKHEGIPAPVVNCDVCGLRLTSERSRKLHKETQHPVGGKQDHHCPFCDKISPTARALKKHINTMHEKGFDHKCTMCEKAFRRGEALKEHMASHTGTPLYMCPWCPKTFNSNGNMHAHRKNKHPKEYLESKLQRYTLGSVFG